MVRAFYEDRTKPQINYNSQHQNTIPSWTKPKQEVSHSYKLLLSEGIYSLFLLDHPY